MTRVASPLMGHSTTEAKLPHEQIAMRAYEKWCKRGRPHGTHQLDWMEAERELQAEHARLGLHGTRR